MRDGARKPKNAQECTIVNVKGDWGADGGVFLAVVRPQESSPRPRSQHRANVVDYLRLVDRLSATAVPISTDCSVFDFNGDGYVGLADLVAFQATFSGSKQAAGDRDYGAPLAECRRGNARGLACGSRSGVIRTTSRPWRPKTL